MPRRIDVLTLGLSAPSRWNPLYRRFARRRTIENLMVASKAMLLRLDLEDDAMLVLGPSELGLAATCSVLMVPLDDGGLGFSWIGDQRPPRLPRILWGRRS